MHHAGLSIAAAGMCLAPRTRKEAKGRRNQEEIMPFSIVEAIQSHLSADTIAKVAGSTGETPARARSALSAATFATVLGLIRRGSSRAGAAGLLSSLRSSPQGTGLITDGGDELTESVARSSGVSRKSAGAAMGVIAPLAAGVIGHEVTSRNLDADGLGAMLLEEKKSIMNSPNLPAGMGTVLGERRDVAVTNEPMRAAAPARPPARSMNGKGAGRLIALGLAALAIAALLFFTCGRARRPTVSMPETPRMETPVVRTPAIPTPAMPAAPPMQETPAEPTGQTTTTSAEMETKGDYAEGKELPDKVHFVFASTQLVQGSKDEVDKLADGMKAHPNARVRLDGYTDSTGTKEVNDQLSLARANTVKKMIVAKGVDAGRIETAGHATENPAASNDDEKGRTENRRVVATIISMSK
jgi:outer membrane protein OmpA-like peptidoglycan-associated protein